MIHCLQCFTFPEKLIFFLTGSLQVRVTACGMWCAGNIQYSTVLSVGCWLAACMSTVCTLALLLGSLLAIHPVMGEHIAPQWLSSD